MRKSWPAKKNKLMSWKKNVFSYLLWVLYAVATEVGLVCLTDAVCDSLGMGAWAGAVFCVLYMAAAGAGVFLLHRFVPGYSPAAGKKRAVRTAVQAVAAVVLLTAAFVLRVQGIPEAGGESVYCQAALVDGEAASLAGMPAAPYAAGLYIRLLRGLFFFLGNKPAAAIWVQLLLQMGAILLVYLAAGKLAGSLAATVMLAFHAASSYLIREASVLSPAMLYFFLWAAVLLVIAAAAGAGKSPGGFLPAGILIGILCFLDVAGCLLLLTAAAAVLSGKEPEAGRRRKCLLYCLAGFGAGLAGCGLVLALIRGESFFRVWGTWLSLYRPGGFRLPFSVAAAGSVAEYLILFCILTPGIFAFWRDRRRDTVKAWILFAAVLALAGCFGIFTEEMPMGLYMYLLLTMLAGLAVAECVRKTEAVSAAAPAMAAAGERSAGLPEETVPGVEGLTENQQPAVRPADDTVPGSGKQQEANAPASGEEDKPAAKPVKYIDNPLPLPKKHVKRKLEYGLEVPAGKEDFDLQVDEKDDFDI